MKTLNKKQPIIVVCENGKTSEAAAFLLLRNRIKAFVLQGGMEKVPDQPVDKPATFAVDEHDDETPLSVDEAAKTAAEQPGLNSEPDSEQLKQTIAQLEVKCQTLRQERDELARKYKQLFKQSEKMKAFLDSLRNGNNQ
nr:rhodanese-like domain-containing protein [Methylomarinum sp. Ch1-1]MDP4522194.1 rhodanese-like domain-containing protein [Methylomarinum sp. Ch1-1]